VITEMVTKKRATSTAATACYWCERPFRVRRTGGRAQRFCRMSCRRQFHAARRWALDAIGSGVLSLGEIKQGFQRTRALLQGSSSAVGVPGYGDPGQRLRAAAAVYECHAPVVAAGTFELISVRQGRAGVPCTCTPPTDVERIAAIKQRKRVMARSGVEFSLWPMCAGMARSRRFRPFACSSLLFFCCLGQF